jgi:hypothetical protein
VIEDDTALSMTYLHSGLFDSTVIVAISDTASPLNARPFAEAAAVV